MDSNQEIEPLEKCSEEPVHTVKESVEKLFSLINTEFSRLSALDKEGDLSFLELLCEAKANILKDNPFWSMYDRVAMLTSLALGRIDWLDVEGQWDKASNKENYKIIKEALRDLKDYYPSWKLNEHDVKRHSICPSCGISKSATKK